MKVYKIGNSFEKKYCITEEMGEQFAKISGDFNPIHLDQEKAEQTIFKKKIVHGMLVGSYISGIIGNDFPGNGTIYLKQNLMFKRPVLYNQEITIKVEIVDIDEEKSRLVLGTTCYDDKGQMLLDGEALVKVEE